MNQLFYYAGIKELIFPLFLILLIIAMAQCSNNNELKTGKEIYQAYCVNCHGVDGRLSTNAAIDLSRSRLPMDGRLEIIKNGRVTMMGFDGVISKDQIDSVARYTLELQK